MKAARNIAAAADVRRNARRLHAAALAPRLPSARDCEIADALAAALRRRP